MIKNVYAASDLIHVLGNSDGGDYQYMTIIGGFLKIEGTGDGVPSDNTIENLCIQYQSTPSITFQTIRAPLCYRGDLTKAAPVF